MSQNKVILLLGTNLGNKKNNLIIAKELINRDIGDIKKESNILENEAEGFITNNLFLNQKIEITTELNPFEILRKVKNIEKNMGRIYPKPLGNNMYTDRLIDIDILFFNKISLNSSCLIIPHPQVYTRNFVKSLAFI